MIVILGKNGSGKTFIANKLFDLGFYRSVNYTTRPMRDGERNGLDYIFISNEDFERLIQDEYFVEYKKRKEQYYGTPKHNLKSNAILLAGDIDKIRTLSKEEVIPLYIDCDIEFRFKRVKARGENKENLFKRFHDENFAYLYNFSGIFIDNNNDNTNALNTIRGILDSDGHIVDRSLISSNREFIVTQTQGCVERASSELLTYLKYEEYLLRKIMLLFNLRDVNSYFEMLEYYYISMGEYLKSQNIVSTRKSQEEMIVSLDNKIYQADFKKEKVLRRN